MDTSALRRPVGRRPAALTALAVLAVTTVLALWTVTPPAPRGTEAPAGVFSAARAHRFVEGYATTAHPTGSPANDAVRGYLLGTLTGFGLSPRVQDAVGAEQDDSAIGGGGNAVSLARVRNVVVELPGTAPTGRVFLVAHYDSVQNGPGANDDGAGVGVLLELARALTAGHVRTRNDLVLVFTDAEEACLCGAEAFAGQDPLASDGGVVLNLEARGSGGPPILFETSRGNAKLVDVYRSVPYPVGTSFAVEVYRILPNDTDFSAFRDHGGFTGLNSAYIDGSAVYHAPEDTLDRVDEGSVQAHGDNALALAERFGAVDLTGYAAPAGHDDTYFPVLGALVTYPGWLVWPLAVVALLVVLAAGALALRRGRLRVGRALAGVGLGVVPLLLSAVAAQLFWLLLTTLRPGYANLADPWRPGGYRLAVTALTFAIVLTWYALGRRRLEPSALRFGALVWLALLGLVLAAVTPGGSYLGAVPALAGGLAMLLDTALAPRGGLATLLGAVVAVLVLAPTAMLFFPALGLAVGGAAAFFVAALALALLPALEWLYPDPTRRTPRRYGLRASAAPALACLLVAALASTAGLALDRFDARHPRPSQLMYALDRSTGQARWVSVAGSPDQWTRQYLADSGREDLSTAFPLLNLAVATGPATVADLPAPTVSVVSESTVDGRRTVTFDLVSHRPVRLTYFQVQAGTRVVGATVDGRVLPGDRLGGRFAVLFHAPPDGALRVTLALDGSGPLRLRVMDGSDGLTELPGFVPRPADVTVAGTHISDLVVVADTVTVPQAAATN